MHKVQQHSNEITNHQLTEVTEDFIPTCCHYKSPGLAALDSEEEPYEQFVVTNCLKTKWQQLHESTWRSSPLVNLGWYLTMTLQHTQLLLCQVRWQNTVTIWNSGFRQLWTGGRSTGRRANHFSGELAIKREKYPCSQIAPTDWQFCLISYTEK